MGVVGGLFGSLGRGAGGWNRRNGKIHGRTVVESCRLFNSSARWYSVTVMKRMTSQARQLRRYQRLQRDWLEVLRRYPTADPDNVWHTLLLLEEPPVERLRRGFLRAGNEINL